MRWSWSCGSRSLPSHVNSRTIVSFALTCSMVMGTGYRQIFLMTAMVASSLGEAKSPMALRSDS